MTIKKHRWSGWPGAFCLDCGVEHAEENAMALDWIYVDSSYNNVWRSPELKDYVEFLDSNCLSGATEEEKKQYINTVNELRLACGLGDEK